MNALVWNVSLLGKIDDRLAVCVSGPCVDSWLIEHETGQYPRAYVGDGFATEQQAMDFCEGRDGTGGLVYDVMYKIELKSEVIA